MPKRNHMIVNLGDTLSRATNFKLKATSHRVLDIGIERYSNAFFFEPRFSTVIPANLLNHEEEAVESPVMYGEFLVKKMVESYAEWKDFKLPPKA